MRPVQFVHRRHDAEEAVSANHLGPRKVRALSRITGMDVVRASVWSHSESGRWAHLRTADGRCWWYDRKEDRWKRHGDCPPDGVRS